MPRAVQIASFPPAAMVGSDKSIAKCVYFDSLTALVEGDRAISRTFLYEQLQSVQDIPSDLPYDMRRLSSWITHNTEQVGIQYRAYLDARAAGGGRKYFSSKSHAFNFLKSVAPTKLADGAWLYGLLERWNDVRFSSLIKIYLEELGEGLPDKNHVVLYKKLLASHGCDQWENLSDDHFVQGAIQLSLAQHAAEFLPEVIGFNLGYEQLPLHLLITAYELNELGIDPYYFTLHVTVDNAATGHAKKSLDGLMDALPRTTDANAFYRRVMNGYKLNTLGVSTESAIESFNLDKEMVAIFTAKAAVGAQMHSDYCRVEGRTINDWLSNPADIPAFLENLQKSGWIKRHQDPQNSRFWSLIQGEQAKMFGVFTAYEQQVVHDWIAGDADAESGHETGGRPRRLTYQAARGLRDIAASTPRSKRYGTVARAVLRQRFSHHNARRGMDGFSAELRTLEENLAAMGSREEVMSALIHLMSPAGHHTASGMMATRIFTRLFT